MKKANNIDKITIGIILLNLISFIIGVIYNRPHKTSWIDELGVLNNFYILLGIPLSVFIGMLLNLTSLMNKIAFKTGTKAHISLNVVLFVIFSLMILVWQSFLGE
ncbi:MAG: hypothetical protein E7415_06995 [Ruminococcaceae bacterium]|nr:hypothetical protein [Oscillospiraceae bacterium]